MEIPMTLLVTGSVAFDSLETPFGRRDDCLGGTAVYFSLGASLFCPVELVAVVGEDFPDAVLQEALAGRPVDVSGLEKRQGSRTFRWKGKYEGAMNEAVTLDTQLGVLAEKGPVVPTAFRKAEYVFLANSHPLLQAELLASLAAPRLVIADTMNLWINHEKPALVALLAKVQGLVINDGEARLLTDQTNLVQAGQDILKLGPEFVVLKKGEHGCLLFQGSDVAALPALPAARVVDPTGAGDSFAGGFCGYLCASRLHQPRLHDLVRAAAYGTCVASFTIEDFSVSALRAATRKGLDGRLDKFRAMLTI
jgi:cytidine kinase